MLEWRSWIQPGPLYPQAGAPSGLGPTEPTTTDPGPISTQKTSLTLLETGPLPSARNRRQRRINRRQRLCRRPHSAPYSRKIFSRPRIFAESLRSRPSAKALPRAHGGPSEEKSNHYELTDFQILFADGRTGVPSVLAQNARQRRLCRRLLSAKRSSPATKCISPANTHISPANTHISPANTHAAAHITYISHPQVHTS
jgi:hypothetical protein